MRGLRWFLVVVVCLLMSLPAGLAAQQKVRDGTFREEEIEDNTLLEAGRMEAGIILAGSWSSDSGTAEGGETLTQTPWYGLAGAHFGYMITDNFEARLQGGVMKLATVNNDTVLQQTFAPQATAQGLYHLSFQYGTGLYMGAGLGSFFAGNTDRQTTTAGGESIVVENATNGFIAQGLLGFFAQPGPAFTIRFGPRFDFLAGKEVPSGGTNQPARTATNFKLIGMLEMSFRFGG